MGQHRKMSYVNQPMGYSAQPMMQQSMMMAPQPVMEQPMMMAPQPIMQQPMMMPAPVQVNSNDPEANAPPGYKFAGYAPEPTEGESYPGWDFNGGKWIYKGEPEPPTIMPAPQPMMMAAPQPTTMMQGMSAQPMMAAPGYGSTMMMQGMSAQPMMAAPGYGYGY